MPPFRDFQTSDLLSLNFPNADDLSWNDCEAQESVYHSVSKNRGGWWLHRSIRTFTKVPDNRSRRPKWRVDVEPAASTRDMAAALKGADKAAMIADLGK